MEPTAKLFVAMSCFVIYQEKIYDLLAKSRKDVLDSSKILKVVGQDGIEIYFKCKQTTPLKKLMDATCERGADCRIAGCPQHPSGNDWIGPRVSFTLQFNSRGHPQARALCLVVGPRVDRLSVLRWLRSW